MINQERLKELLHYDHETGVFTYRVKTSYRVEIGDVAGCDNGKGYLQIRLDTVLYKAHRLAWLYMMGEFPVLGIDHENGIRGDNRWDNIREATKKRNGENQRKAHKNSTTGLLGVTNRGSKFRATLHDAGVRHYLGDFDTPEEAHAAYVSVKRQLHEGCTI